MNPPGCIPGQDTAQSTFMLIGAVLPKNLTQPPNQGALLQLHARPDAHDLAPRLPPDHRLIYAEQFAVVRQDALVA